MTLTGNVHQLESVAVDAPGWRGLLDGLKFRLETFDFEIVIQEVKEKFGVLRIYVTLPSDVSTHRRHDVDEWVAAAEQATYLICYLCGAGVTHQGTGNWVRYFCDDHDTADVFFARARRSESARTPPSASDPRP